MPKKESRSMMSALCVGLLASLAQADQIYPGEYFFDSDPGQGNGVAFSTAIDGSATLDLGAAVIDGLSIGSHTLGIRVQAGSGDWSVAQYRVFTKMDLQYDRATEPVAGEYFWDSDPGIGQGTTFVLSGGDAVIDLTGGDIAGLAVGAHQMGLRVKDAEGRWSVTDYRSFTKMDVAYDQATEPIAGEYFWDVDPGVGNGNAFSLVGGDAVIDLSGQDVAGLSFGVHQMGVRVRDAEGRWSQLEWRSFVRVESLDLDLSDSVENLFWVIRDSGNNVVKTGKMATSGGPTVLVNRVIDVSDLTEGGMYQLEIAAADEIGRSGPLTVYAFVVTQDANDTNQNGVPDDASAENYQYSDFVTRRISSSAPGNPGLYLSGELDDADADGLTNLLEYYLGGDPLRRNLRLVEGTTRDLTGELNPAMVENRYLSLEFTEVKAARGEYSVVVEYSTDPSREDGWAAVVSEPEVLSDDGETRRLRYYDDEPFSDSNRRFMRLRVVPNP